MNNEIHIIHMLWVLLVPLLFGTASSWAYLKLRSRKKKPSALDFFVVFILYPYFAVVGEILARFIYKTPYQLIGDNFIQITGIAFDLLACFLMNPILIIIFRVRMREKSKNDI